MELDEHESSWPAGGVHPVEDGHECLALVGLWSDAAGENAAVFVAETLGLSASAVGSVEEELEAGVKGGDVVVSPGMNWFRCDGRDPGEVQYGSGYGDTMTIEPYWLLSPVSAAEVQRIAPEVLARESKRWAIGGSAWNDVWIEPPEESCGVGAEINAGDWR